MALLDRLAHQLIRCHPEQAAAVLEPLGAGEAARVAREAEPDEAAALVAAMAPFFAAAVLERLAPDEAAAIVAPLETDAAAGPLRRLPDEHRERVVAALPARAARPLRAVLRFAPDTAGALMDPEVLALPEDLRAEEALARVRESPEHARYNLYVVDRAQRLVGVLNLHELMGAPPDTRLAERMVRDPLRLEADAHRAEVVGHPGWKQVHALPVTDAEGRYLGAIRYRTLRALEAELFAPARPERRASAALGELFAAGAAGVLEALAAPAAEGERVGRRG